ncbi:MAG: DUF3500 domain-containing protein [Sphingobacteriales bacterium]|nr:DUF3500 domain-containing protein [Sphingobacteriales bacterium]OJY81888.1 MAG: hypothetical protein BGP14_03770 [Sphingobacteriales bacterium 44-15]
MSSVYRPCLYTVVCLLLSPVLRGQSFAAAAKTFVELLNDDQKVKAVLPFDMEERYNFHYIPKDNRKGISMNELDERQKQEAFHLLRMGIASETIKKMQDIMQLEMVLRTLEGRSADDHYRDPGKYFLTIFGQPETNTIWGLRFEGHHISFNFSVNNDTIAAGTPSFLGANPAIVQEGPQKNKEVLKEETNMAFALLHAFSQQERTKAVIDTNVPGDIITGAGRKAMIEHPQGIRYSEMNGAAQREMLALLQLYIHRYTKLFADDMLKDIKAAGLNNLWFTWEGHTEKKIGNPCYYRIQGPTIIIEYDNTQNNANHIHTVVRDLKNDFGGDELLEHYRQAH